MSKIDHEIILRSGKYDKLSLKGIGPKIAIDLYSFMLRLRKLQEKIINEYHPANEMRCPVHFSIGQEAVPAALSRVIKKHDVLFGPHRSHGYYLAKGGPMNALLAELYGRKTGTNGGKTGSQEISMPAINFYSGAILSGLLAIAVGVGLGFKLQNKPNVAVAAFGDGAIDEGIFWEAISYAQLCRLPVVFICENNRYSTYSNQLKRQPADNIHEKVAAFGLKTEAIFGNDVIKVMSTLSEAIDHAREGKGPAFVEAYTYRWKGHVGPEDDDYVGYRPAEEIEFWKRNCPILLLEEKLIAGKILTNDMKEKILALIDKEISEAFTFAKNSPFPEVENWEEQNYSDESPVADRLLKTEDNLKEFDHQQAETMPEPY